MVAALKISAVFLSLLGAISTASAQTPSPAPSPETDLRGQLERLLAEPKDLPTYHYTIGVTYHRLGQLGPAYGHFKKAAKTSAQIPTELLDNLKITEDQLRQRLGSDRLVPANTFLEETGKLIEETPGGSLIQPFLAALILGACLFWLRDYFRTRKLKASLLSPAAIFLYVVLCGQVVTSAATHLHQTRPEAIVLNPAEPIRSGPGVQFVELSKVDAGVTLRFLGERQGDWLQIRYAKNSGIGWIKASSLLLL